MNEPKQIRRARPEDAPAIHEAHLRSIKEVCSKDHTPQEINAWIERIRSQAARLKAIADDFVWVIDRAGQIEGFAHLAIHQDGDERLAFIMGQYLAPEAISQGFGREIFRLMITEAKARNCRSISIDSTRTARSFYQKLGFKESGAPITVQIGNEEISCFPMTLRLT